jgi:hypothetical protein
MDRCGCHGLASAGGRLSPIRAEPPRTPRGRHLHVEAAGQVEPEGDVEREGEGDVEREGEGGVGVEGGLRVAGDLRTPQSLRCTS